MTALTAGAATTLVLLAGCTTTGPSGDDAPTAAPTASLGAFYGQEPEWGPCVDTATTAADAALYANPDLECATVEVPLDYDRPDDDRASISVLRKPAVGEREGALVMNPGGPGISGNSDVALFAPAWATNPINEHYDIVGFDPRGVGASTPRVDCYDDEEYDAGEGFRGGAVYDITSSEQAQAVAERCIEGSGGIDQLTSVGTVDVVRDLDVIRDALGEEKLTYLGYSYGTEVGAMYATAYPDNVRAVVLDGVVAPDLTAEEFRLSQFAGFQATFEKLAAVCARDETCPLGTEPQDATDRLHEILRPLRSDPLPVSGGRELTEQDALFAVTSGLYAESQWPQVITGLREAAAGHGDALMALRDLFQGRGEDGTYASDPDANVAIRCMDWPARSADEQTDLARRIVDSAPILDREDGDTRFHHECEAWPEAPSRDEPWLDAEGVDVPPTLTVSVTGDPATPHEGGVAMARELGGGLLTVDGNQHGAYMRGGSDCVDEIVEAFVLQLQMPDDGARCSL
ncbi:alpha/beta fold hydrolase [Phycicoccus sp. CSK15P-2]|uniref:alpha/beta hydrolase n=1 Tax=Phycicoccus sp. CSK15P-2 TaxID=2807627 RepID=UPI0019525C00|nr:alpha/beta hydrolase [Phycicoccus sp. CSK15P-2]MBM6403055.1 alpha/beta fold hydrolase [Phycicoccus sp. CSK15P-2]